MFRITRTVLKRDLNDLTKKILLAVRNCTSMAEAEAKAKEVTDKWKKENTYGIRDSEL